MNVQRAFKQVLCCALAFTCMWLAPAPRAYAAENPLTPLNYFVGDWDCSGHFANGKPVHSHDAVSSELGGHWMRIRHVEEPPGRWHVDEWWGYDKIAKRFTVALFDNFGSERHYVSSGWNGDVLTLENTATSGFIDRFMFKRQGDAAYRVVYSYRNGAGAWRVGDAQVCKRTSQTPGP